MGYSRLSSLSDRGVLLWAGVPGCATRLRGYSSAPRGGDGFSREVSRERGQFQQAERSRSLQMAPRSLQGLTTAMLGRPGSLDSLRRVEPAG
jgi:hypothetical protein